MNRRAPHHGPNCSTFQRPCGCGFRHHQDCPLRQKSRARLSEGEAFKSLEELDHWFNMRTTVWVRYAGRPIPCAFVISQPYRNILRDYRAGSYRKVTGYDIEVLP